MVSYEIFFIFTKIIRVLAVFRFLFYFNLFLAGTFLFWAYLVITLFVVQHQTWNCLINHFQKKDLHLIIVGYFTIIQTIVSFKVMFCFFRKIEEIIPFLIKIIKIYLKISQEFIYVFIFISLIKYIYISSIFIHSL